MAFTMHHSDAFKKEKRACDAYLGLSDSLTPQGVAQSVYLIYRVNGNDSTMRTMISQAYRKTLHTGLGGLEPGVRGTSGEKRGKGNVRYATVTKPAGVQGGGHAEEIFIRSLSKTLAELDAAQVTVREFEIFLSRIPCVRDGAVGSKAFMKDATLFPEGCGVKLHLMVGMLPNIHWSFCYERDYTGESIDQETKRQMVTMAAVRNADVWRYTGPGVIEQITAAGN